MNENMEIMNGKAKMFIVEFPLTQMNRKSHKPPVCSYRPVRLPLNTSLPLYVSPNHYKNNDYTFRKMKSSCRCMFPHIGEVTKKTLVDILWNIGDVIR